MTSDFPDDMPLERHKKHLAALEIFMAGPAYAGYQRAIENEIAFANGEILEADVKDLSGLIKLFEFRGVRRAAMDELTRFEGARANLIDVIDRLVDEENERTTTKI